MAYHLGSITIVTITICYIILRTIPLAFTHYDRRKLSQVSHYPGETVIWIDCNQLDKYPNTNPHFPARVTLGHLSYNSGLNFAGSISTALSGTNQLLGRSGLACPWTHIWLPAHPYYLQCVHFDRMRPGLSWATWLRGRNEFSGQLSERHVFNLERSANIGTILNRHGHDQHSQPNTIAYKIPPGLHLITSYGYFTR